mmetsp:Transcript_28001/g.65428  ORF Transcript_28001/g.65428 Transcript_28001/m.65428 type:complete len:148 (-) Transcript_28001:182-625(-)
MPPTERRAFTRRSWELWVSPVLQDAAWEHTHLAQLSSHLECFGGYVNARDHDGSAALHAAAESGHAEAVDSLLRAQAEPNIKTNCGLTPLHFSAREGHADVTQLLVVSRADVHARNRVGATPLDEARRYVVGEWKDVCAILERPGLV